MSQKFAQIRETVDARAFRCRPEVRATRLISADDSGSNDFYVSESDGMKRNSRHVGRLVYHTYIGRHSDSKREGHL